MEESGSDNEHDESSPDGVKKIISKLIKRFKAIKVPAHTTDRCQTPEKASPVPSRNDCYTCYNFNHLKRGFAVFIINSEFCTQPKRPFANEDCKKMLELFVLLDFEVIMLENKTSAQLWQSLKEIREKVGDDCDCLACVISSHGAEVEVTSPGSCGPRSRQHVIFTKDGIIPTNYLLEIFNNECCPYLEGKPRIYFIQACRTIYGKPDNIDEVDQGVGVEFVYQSVSGEDVPIKMKRTWGNVRRRDTVGDTHGRPDDNREINHSHFRTSDTPETCDVPCFEDYLVMFSSSPEKIAWSDCGKGGWLIYCLYHVFNHLLDSDHSVNLVHILTDVCHKMANEMETRTPSKSLYDKSKSAATIYHMLTKDIVFKSLYQEVPVPLPVRETAV